MLSVNITAIQQTRTSQQSIVISLGENNLESNTTRHWHIQQYNMLSTIKQWMWSLKLRAKFKLFYLSGCNISFQLCLDGKTHFKQTICNPLINHSWGLKTFKNYSSDLISVKCSSLTNSILLKRLQLRQNSFFNCLSVPRWLIYRNWCKITVENCNFLQ